MTAAAQPGASTAGNPAPAAAPSRTSSQPGPPLVRRWPAVRDRQPVGGAGQSGEQDRPGRARATTPGAAAGPPPGRDPRRRSRRHQPRRRVRSGGRLTSSHAGRAGPSRRQACAGPPGPRRGQRAAPGDDAETFSAEELASACGGTVAMVTELQQYGLITARVVVGGTPYFDAAALDVARAAAGFSRYGVEARHLRAWRNSADREAGIFEQVIMPLLRQRNPEARRQAARHPGGAGLARRRPAPGPGRPGLASSRARIPRGRPVRPDLATDGGPGRVASVLPSADSDRAGAGGVTCSHGGDAPERRPGGVAEQHSDPAVAGGPRRQPDAADLHRPGRGPGDRLRPARGRHARGP